MLRDRLSDDEHPSEPQKVETRRQKPERTKPFIMADKAPNSKATATAAASASGNSDLGEWVHATPVELLEGKFELSREIDAKEAWKALHYGHYHHDDTGNDDDGKGSNKKAKELYDDIGHRISAATPYRGQVPLTTLPKMMWQQRHDDLKSKWLEVERISNTLRPWAIDFTADGSFRFEVHETTIDFFSKKSTPMGVGYEERWTFSKTHPPTFILKIAEEDTSGHRFVCKRLQSVKWVPLTVLLKHGKFCRFQMWKEQLTIGPGEGILPLFISHRWLSKNDPD